MGGIRNLGLGFVALALAGTADVASAACPLGTSGTVTVHEWDGTAGPAAPFLGGLEDSLSEFTLAAHPDCKFGKLTVSIAWEQPLFDIDLTVAAPDGSTKASEAYNILLGARESVQFDPGKAGKYAITVSGYISADTPYHGTATLELRESDGLPLDSLPVGTGRARDDVVVIAVIDSNFNPYHWDYLAAKMPQHLNTDPSDDLPLDQDPATWIPGHPGAAAFKSYQRVDLTLKPDDPAASSTALHQADQAQWNKIRYSEGSANSQVNMYWMPGTKVIGHVAFSELVGVAEPHSSNALGASTGPVDTWAVASHGNGSATVSAGNIHGSCPNCVLVFVHGTSEQANAWVAQQDWIDLQTNSWGLSTLSPVRDRAYAGSDTEAQRRAIERGQSIFFSAGNGVENAFIVPNPTLLSSQEGPDWIVTVGGVSPDDGSSYSGAGKPADIASVGSGYPSAPNFDDPPTAPADPAVNAADTFGGTSNATPVIAGIYGEALYRLRRMQDGGNRAQASGVIVSNGAPGCGAANADCALKDGAVTVHELREALYRAARYTPAGLNTAQGIAPIPTTENYDELTFLAEGHGTYFGRLHGDYDYQAEIRRIIDWVTGAQHAPQDAAQKAWFIADSYCRQSTWGSWRFGYADGSNTPARDTEWPVRSWLAEGCPAVLPPLVEAARVYYLNESTAPADGDIDGVPDDADNCPAAANRDQRDTDGDGTGDACEGETGGASLLPDQCDPTGQLPQGANCLSNVPVVGPALFGNGGGAPTDPEVPVASCEKGENLDGNRHYHVMLTAPDGNVNSFEVFEPTSFDCANRSRGAHPLMLQGHGYGGSRNTGANDFRSWRDAGYTVISIDQRGFGASSGTVRVMDPDFEGRNLLQILDWAEDNLDYLSWRDESTGEFVARPAGANVSSVANGVNLVAGAIGGSYGGGYQLLLLAVDAKKRLDAIQPDITWHDLRYSLNPGDTIKAQYDTLLFAAGEATSNAAGLQNHQAPNGQDPFIKEAFARGGSTGEFPRQALDWFRYHSLSHWCGASGLPTMPYKAYGPELVPMVDATGADNTPAPQPDGKPGIGSLHVPPNPLTHFQGLSVRLTQGMADTLFNFNEAWWNAQCLGAAGAEVSLYTHQSGHGLVLPTPGDTVNDFGGGRCLMNNQAWFDSRLKPGTPAPSADVCFSFGPNDQVKMEFDQVLAPQPSFADGTPQAFVDRPILAEQVPNGLAALDSEMGGAPIEVELGTVENPGILAGIARLDVVVESLAGANEIAQDCAPATVPTARLGCDSVVFVGLGLKRGGAGTAQLVDDQLTPLRGLGKHVVDLVGVAERLAVGDELSLLVYGQHIQYYSSFSRDFTIPAVNVTGTVLLPVYGQNGDGTANFTTGRGVLSGGSAPIDSDGDGISDQADNCTMVANTDQQDTDGDNSGDACDLDDDNDGVADADDAFPLDPSESADGDADGVGDNGDNCPATANAGQADADADGIGDACDSPADDTVDAFTFVHRTGVATSSFVTSETKTLAGFDGALPVSVSANGQYRVNGGAWVTAAGTVVAGDTLAVRHVSSANNDATVVTTVSVGGYSTEFKSTTTTVDRTPDAFGFETQTGVARGAVIESNVITPSGFNAPVTVTVSAGAEYRINGGTWTSASGTFNHGDTLQTRHTSSATAQAYTKTSVKLGTVTGYFTTRTQ